MTGKLPAMFKKAAAAIGAAFAIHKVIEFGKASVAAAAEAKAIQAQFDQVFEGIEGQAEKTLNDVAKTVGAIPTRIKPAFNQIASFAKVAGMDTAESLSFTERATKAAADTAAFYDKSLEETTETLKSYLKGNFNVADNLGILSTETTRNAKATEMFGEKYKDLSGVQQQGVLLAMYEDANKVSGALGQAARETDGYENVMGNLKQSFKDFQAIIGGPILTVVIPILQSLTTGIQWLGTYVQNLNFEKLAEGNPIIQTLYDGFNRLVEWFNTAWPSIQQSFMTLWTVIQDVWATVGQPLWTVIEQAIGIVIDFVIANLPKIQEAWSMMVEAISIVWNNILKPVFEVLIDFITNVWEIVSENLPLIQEIFNTVFNEIKQIWENTLKPAFEAIGNFVQNTLRPVIEAGFNAIRDTIRNAFNAIDSFWTNTLKPVFENLDSTVKNIVKSVSDKFNSAKSTVESVFTAIGDKIDSVMSNAKRVVEGAISFIKGLFNFSWSLPKIKLPHFSISGDFSLVPPRVPNVSIDWYAKGGIFDKPTILGSASGLKGVGEAGPEAVAPIAVLMDYVRQAVAEATGVTNEKLLALLEKYLPELANMKVVLSTGETIGALGPEMDKYLGEKDDARRRGR